MRFDRRTLYRFPMPYALGTVEWRGQLCVVAATEDHGPVVISAPPYTTAQVLIPGPGGCMSLVAHPGTKGELWAIMGCFLGYQFDGGAVYRITETPGTPAVSQVAELPFAHRMELIDRGGTFQLLVANLASRKDSPQDWSRPGSVFSFALEEPERGLKPELTGVHKNHGFLKTTLHGRPTLLVSGAEGVFSLDLGPDSTGTFEHILGHEVSEMAILDLDGDGVDELATIEPFHGNSLVVSKHGPDGWYRVWEAPLDYGHCVLADTLHGRPVLLVSNRAGEKEILLFRFPPEGWGAAERFVVDAGVGAANLLVLHGPERLFATNQVSGELVCYEVTP